MQTLFGQIFAQIDSASFSMVLPLLAARLFNRDCYCFCMNKQSTVVETNFYLEQSLHHDFQYRETLVPFL